MLLVQDLSKAQIAFQVAGGDADQFLVVRYRGSEGLCRLYRFEIEVASSERQVDFDDIVGKAAVLTINAPGGERYFHGIVGRFEITGETVGQFYARIELVPAVWLLTHRYNSRIFQNKSVKDIIADVLARAGIASDRFRMGLQHSYEPREYCVQYRETDYNFICRLMEEEGISWYFEQTQESHVFVLADESSAYAPIEGDAKLPYVPPSGLIAGAEHVFRFRLGQSVRPGAVVLNDFNFENPRLNLHATSDVGRDQSLEFSDYPGEYVTQGRGRQLAKLRAEEFESGRTLAIGQSHSHRLAPGRTFELTEHPSTHLNQPYLVTSLTHEGKQSTHRTSAGSNGQMNGVNGRAHQSLLAARQDENVAIRELAETLLQTVARLGAGDPTAHRALTQWVYHAGQVARDLPSTTSASGGHPLEWLAAPNLIDDIPRLPHVDFDAPVYECRFECIPASVTYRPARVTPWPVMRGTQTARVVGPQGEEIYTDKYGCVKVQFNWDREGKFNENSSCWIRVSQGMAGGGYGMMFLPRVGQEVVVDFLEGDPDKPLIVGRVYNGDQMPPYPLPAERTRSVIKTHSTPGGGGTNEIRIEDAKDEEQLFLHAQRDLHVRAEHDCVETVENDRHLIVQKNSFELVRGDAHLTVKGGLRREVAGDLCAKVKGKESRKIEGTLSITCGGDVVESLKSNHKHEVKTTYALKAANIKLEASGGIEIKCGGSAIVLTPSAIFIKGGPLVNINSGSGPPVSPVTASATAPQAPEQPIEADKVEWGKDVIYEADPADPDDVKLIDSEGDPPETTPPPELTWIEIELVDEADQPVPGEKYELKLPDGRIRKSTLDANGLARINGLKPGTCEICFPNLDAEAWDRI